MPPLCPQCRKSVTKTDDHWACPEHGNVTPLDVPADAAADSPSIADTLPQPRRIFISYGHDEFVDVARRLKHDLKARGHEVWFDEERLKPGGDWEHYIEEGLEWVAGGERPGRVVLLMTPHSVRRPDGYCLNEIARALSRNLPIVPVMVVWCEPPLSICCIQWLDMRECLPLEQRSERYEAKRGQLLGALEADHLETHVFEAPHVALCKALDPIPFEGDIAPHLRRFIGRRWVFEQVDDWIADPDASRVFWIMGDPGVGKTALAAWLCTHRREIVGMHFCRHGHRQKADPKNCVTSLAYQLATQLPDYGKHLLGLKLEELVRESDARTLFDRLLVQPLAGNFPRPAERIVVLIDALDEATRDGRNELASFLAAEFARTPDWLRLIITSRPEAEVRAPLQWYMPQVLNASSPDNLDDLRAYLRHELLPFSPAGAVSPDVVETIVERVAGTTIDRTNSAGSQPITASSTSVLRFATGRARIRDPDEPSEPRRLRAPPRRRPTPIRCAPPVTGAYRTRAAASAHTPYSRWTCSESMSCSLKSHRREAGDELSEHPHRGGHPFA